MERNFETITSMSQSAIDKLRAMSLFEDRHNVLNSYGELAAAYYAMMEGKPEDDLTDIDEIERKMERYTQKYLTLKKMHMTTLYKMEYKIKTLAHDHKYNV